MTDDTQQPKRKRSKKQPTETIRFTEQQLVVFGEIFPGFDVWYRANYDENGQMLASGQMPGLRAPEEDEEE